MLPACNILCAVFLATVLNGPPVAFGIEPLKNRRGSSSLESQLYEDLLYSHNKIPRPVNNSADLLMIDVGAALIRIIDIDEKNQVFTTNLWLEMQWYDSKLRWDPRLYGGLKKLHIPSELIWTPDLVLYNNAAGDPDITIYTDALVSFDGRVFWQPPAIFKSFCAIDVTWFPYDIQNCEMKFGIWTYTGFYVDLRQLPREDVTKRVKDGEDVEYMERGMDLSYFYKSAEWDLLSLESERHSKLYSTCCGPEKYVDITYYFVLRRKTLFFTCNLIIPCFLISFLTTFVFYLSDHKITFAISILVTLTVFFLILIDIIPPTSLVIPMFGRYLMATMVLVALSVVISVISVNFHFRCGATHKMPAITRRIFLNLLPRLLMMDRPGGFDDCMGGCDDRKEYMESARPGRDNMEASSLIDSDRSKDAAVDNGNGAGQMQPQRPKELELPSSYAYMLKESPLISRVEETQFEKRARVHKQILMRVLQQVRFISEHFRQVEIDSKISDDWTYVAMVIDRLFLVVFAILNLGTVLIILTAPTLYDTREPLNITIPNKPLGQSNLFGHEEHYFL